MVWLFAGASSLIYRLKIWSGEMLPERSQFFYHNILLTLTWHPLLFLHDSQHPDISPPSTSRGTQRPSSSVLSSSASKIFSVGMGVISRIPKFFVQFETNIIWFSTTTNNVTPPLPRSQSAPTGPASRPLSQAIGITHCTRQTSQNPPEWHHLCHIPNLYPRQIYQRDNFTRATIVGNKNIISATHNEAAEQTIIWWNRCRHDGTDDDMAPNGSWHAKEQKMSCSIRW